MHKLPYLIAVVAVVVAAATATTVAATTTTPTFLLALDEVGRSSLNVWADGVFYACERKFERGGVHLRTGREGRLLVSGREGPSQRFGFGYLPAEVAAPGDWCAAADSFAALASTPHGAPVIAEGGRAIYFTDGATLGSFVPDGDGGWLLKNPLTDLAPQLADKFPPPAGITAISPFGEDVWHYYRSANEFWRNYYVPTEMLGYVWQNNTSTFYRPGLLSMDMGPCGEHGVIVGVYPRASPPGREVRNVITQALIYQTSMELDNIKVAENCTYYLFGDYDVLELDAGEFLSGNEDDYLVLHSEKKIFDLEPLTLRGGGPVRLPDSEQVWHIEVCGTPLERLPSPNVSFTPETSSVLYESVDSSGPCSVTIRRGYLFQSPGVEQVVNLTVHVEDLGTHLLLAPPVYAECGGNLTLGIVHPVVDACGGGCVLWDPEITTKVLDTFVVYRATDPCGTVVNATVPIIERDIRPPTITLLGLDDPECAAPRAVVSDLCDGMRYAAPTHFNTTTCGITWHWTECDAAGNCATASATKEFL